MEMLELAAELKWCRERIAALEAERDQLLATPADKREDLRCVIADISAQCAALWAERDQLLARIEDTDIACADYAFAGAHTAREIIEKLHDRIRGYKTDRDLLAEANDQLRAELAVLRGRIADDAALVSEYTLLLRDAYNLCNPAWPWMHGLLERIRAALAAKGDE